MSIAEKLQTIADNEQNVYNSGKKAEYDRFWDAYQKNGKRADYTQAFCYGWDDKTYNPKYDIKTAGGNLQLAYQNTGITDTKVDIEVYSGTARRIFYNASNLKTIKNFKVNKDIYYAQCFDGCTGLEELRIEGTIGQSGINLEWSKSLSHDSIWSVIKALSDTLGNESELFITLSYDAVSKAFETEEGANDGSTSPEWNYLMVLKSADGGEGGVWTVSLN